MKFTTEFVRKYWHLLEALKEGRTLQASVMTGPLQYWFDNDCDFSLGPDKYRVKPEPVYRPLTPVESAGYLDTKVIRKSTRVELEIRRVGKDTVILSNGNYYFYSQLLALFTFPNGNPVGILVERN